MTRKELRDFLVFWEKLPDRAFPPGEEKDAWVNGLRVSIRAIPDGAIGGFVDFWRGRYLQIEADRISSTSRGIALLTLVGVITAATTLIVSSVVKTALVWQVLIGMIGAPLLLSIAATVFLAVRVQQVSNWDSPRLTPARFASARQLLTEEAVEYVAAAEQDIKRVNNVVGYLRDAQRWALVAVTLLVLLAPTAVLAAFSKTSDTTVVAPNSSIPGGSPPANSAPVPTP